MADDADKGAAGSLVELVTIVAVALGLALGIQAFLVKPFRIPSESMVPTLAVGQRVLVDRATTRFNDPSVGDVLVFKPPRGADENRCGVRRPAETPCPQGTGDRSDMNFIKRVVAVEGDKISVKRGRVYLSGELQEKEAKFIRPSADCPTCNLPREITIPENHVYMMGDNRGESADSREWGPVPEKWLIGNAFVMYWPPGRVGGL